MSATAETAAALPRPLAVVVAEHQGGQAARVTLEMLSLARQLAAWQGLEVRLLVLDGQPLAARLAQETGQATLALACPGLEGFHGEAWLTALARVLPGLGARVVLGAHTSSGLEWLPGLAVDMGAACLTAVEQAHWDDKGLTLTRAGHHGKLLEEVRPRPGLPLVLSVQPGAFAAAPPLAGGPGPLEALVLEPLAMRTRVLGVSQGAGQDAALAQAPVVVAAGRGIGQPENLELVRRLAALFPSAAVAGSRPVCETGWLSLRSQVGITGATVSPRLYLACGISGARQHTMGMQGAGFIVAISNDPQAAIFNLADVAVVADLNRFIPAFLALAEAEPA